MPEEVEEADGAAMVPRRVEEVVGGLENAFMNNSLSEYTQDKASRPTPAQEAEARRLAALRQAAERKATQAMKQAGTNLAGVLKKTTEGREREAGELSKMHALIDGMYNSTGYAAADISQCGDHCGDNVGSALHPATR